MWEMSRGHALGTGFLAVERMIPAIVSEDMVGWVAAHSHNGFLSAWLAAGWLGLGLIVSFTAALCLQAMGTGAAGRALAVPFLLFVLVNNMSYPAFGGRLNGAWLMVMGLAFATAPRPARAGTPVPVAVPAREIRATGTALRPWSPVPHRGA
jgi:O-antigen ligase